MTEDLSNDDRGKEVVAGSKRVGVVTDVRGGTAYVDPDLDGVDDDLRAALDWNQDDDEYTVDSDAVTEIHNAEVRLRDDFG